MSSFNIPDDVIDGVAAQIHSKINRDYKIPVVGVAGNLETPQVFEIIPFDKIDTPTARFMQSTAVATATPSITGSLSASIRPATFASAKASRSV